MATATFQFVYLPDYMKALGKYPRYFHFAIDAVYTHRKMVKNVQSYFDWLFAEPEEQYRPLLTYTVRGIGRTAGDRALLWSLNEATMRYREFGDTGSFYFCRKNRKLYTKSFVRKVVRDWGYDLR